ncbi:hypothetical protein WN944_013073 [Citrus x changshan-huyou]|uniref:Uncharacterized protein n=1 Tax=Citrus x changshan-huyou TaxID=2935761 RepID=A0AAP0M7Z2_9ROSI
MQAEIHDSTAGGNFVTLTLTSRISVGEQNPPKILEAEVYCEADESGGLCIEGHSSDHAIHSSVPQVQRIVIDPSRIGAGSFKLKDN